MSLTETAVHRPVAVVVIFALLIGLAVFLVPSIPVELFPDLEMPVLMISTQYRGAGPEDVERNITEVLEKQLSNVSDLESITSTSAEGYSLINMEFDFSKDLDEATNDVRDRLEIVSGLLPDEAGSPTILKLNTDNQPFLTLGLLGDLSQNKLRSIAEDTIQPLLERIGGVATITVKGGQEEIVRVQVSQNRLEAYNLTLTEVATILNAQNYQVGAGNLQEGLTEYLIRTDAEFNSLEEISNVVVSYTVVGSDAARKEIYLKDIAEVERTNAEEDDRVFINGEYGVTLSIQKESDANSISVTDKIEQEMDSIKSELPDGVNILVLMDESAEVESIMYQTYLSLFQGVLLAMAVLFLFLRSWSSTIIIALSIPLSIFVTILFMYFMGLTINLMTLTGLILGLGMVVDGSIVIQENIFKFRERGAKLESAAVLGPHEMVMSITASTLTTICVFIPIILFADGIGIFGQVFSALSWTIIIALTVSLVVALVFVPTMAANYLKVYTRKQKPLKNKTLQKIDHAFEIGFNKLDSAYAELLSRLLDNKAKTIILVFMLLVLSVIGFTQLGIIMAPPMSEDTVSVSFSLPQGTPLDETALQILQLTSIVEAVGGYENIVVTAGETTMMGGAAESNKASLEVSLPPYQLQTVTAEEMKKVIRRHYKDFPGAEIEFLAGGPGLGNADPVDILVKSDDLGHAVTFAEELKALIKDKLPGITDAATDMDEGLPQLQVVIDRARAYNLGLNMYAVANEISTSMNGITATTYRVGGDELDVELILRDQDRSSVPDLNKIFIVNNSGNRIAVSNVAHLEKTVGPVAINRDDEMRTVHVTGGLVEGYAATDAQKDIEELLSAQIVVPDGIVVGLGGDFSDILEMGIQLLIVGIIAILLVFGIMAAQFESLKDPFIIFFTIPLMLIGVVGFYTFSGATFSLMSAVGLVVLAGLVVNSGIVLVDYINLLLKRGYKLKEACVSAGRSRLRPILMTTATTILGMFPLAFLGAPGTEQVQPIAQTIIGGLTASSLMTLFFIPILFAVLNGRRYE